MKPCYVRAELLGFRLPMRGMLEESAAVLPQDRAAQRADGRAAARGCASQGRDQCPSSPLSRSPERELIKEPRFPMPARGKSLRQRRAARPGMVESRPGDDEAPSPQGGKYSRRNRS